MMNKNRLLVVGMAVLVFCQFNAFALKFGMSGEFSNGTAPKGGTPWASVDISDDGKGVLVTVSVGDNDIGKLTELYLNYDPTKDIKQLQIAAVNTASVKSWKADTGVNKFKADGDGTYDIKFNFAGDGNPFKSGESLTFRISSKKASDDLSPDDFNFVSVGGAKGSFHSAARVEGMSVSGTGYIGDVANSATPTNGVPDGSWTVTLLGMGVVALEFLRRKLRKSES